MSRTRESLGQVCLTRASSSWGVLKPRPSATQVWDPDYRSFNSSDTLDRREFIFSMVSGSGASSPPSSIRTLNLRLVPTAAIVRPGICSAKS